ncbi:MAG: MFS transporter [Christensenellaceae bacterium]|jgi:DHA3 family macrolide efflux protein-like MFS transporter
METNWKRNMYIFLSSQAISIFGSSLVQYAITWYITLSTNSGAYATLSIICSALPILLLSPFSGVWADRYDKKKLINFADGGIALCTLLVAILYLSGYKALWLLLAASCLRAFGSAVQSPSVSAMLPLIVPASELTRVNGINGSVQSLITLLSPMLSGFLLGFASIEFIFFIDVVTAVLAILVMVVFLRIPKEEKQQTEKPSALRELKEGFSYIKKERYLISFFFFFTLFLVAACPAAFLTPLQVSRAYGGEVWRLSAIEMTFSGGMMLGGVLIAVWGGFKNRIRTIGLAGLVMGVCTLLLGAGVPFPIYLIAMSLFGFAMPFFNTPAIVLLQENVAPYIMGRIFSVMDMVRSSLMPLAILFYGPMADVIPIEWLLLGTGVLLLLVSLGFSLNQPLLQVGKTKEEHA